MEDEVRYHPQKRPPPGSPPGSPTKKTSKKFRIEPPRLAPLEPDLEKRAKLHRDKIAQLTPTMGASADVDYFDMPILLKDGASLNLTIFRPKGEIKTVYPTIFHIPGSGFNTLNPFFAQVTCSQLAEKSGCQVIVINHRLAPEHPFPTGKNDCQEIFECLSTNPHALRILKVDKNNMALSGYSSGGTFSAQIAQKTPQNIKHLFLMSPVMDFSEQKRPYQKIEDKDQNVSPYFVRSMKEYYLSHVPIKDRADPTLSPLFGVLPENHPPTDVIVGSRDRFFGDSILYAERLGRAGINTCLSLIKGATHGAFWYEIDVIIHIAKRIQDIFSLSIPRLPNLSNVTFFLNKKEEEKDYPPTSPEKQITLQGKRKQKH